MTSTDIIDKYSHPKLLVAVDCVIFGYDDVSLELKILLIKRKIEPEPDKWSLMGGFVNIDEDIDQSAERVLKSLTGLNNIFMEQVRVFGKKDRDTGGRVISVAYFALVKFNQFNTLSEETYQASWFSLKNIPALVFDHSEIVKTCLEYLRSKIVAKPLVFELIPLKFTLVQLERVYELILDKKIDRRNFRKKILDTGLIIRLHKKKNLTKSKGRPPELFMFDEELYNDQINDGRIFQFI